MHSFLEKNATHADLDGSALRQDAKRDAPRPTETPNCSQVSVGQVSVCQVSFSQVSVSKVSVGKLSVGEVLVGKSSVSL